MWLAVVLINVTIAVGCFYAARRIWALRYRLLRLEQRIVLLERRVDRLLRQTTQVFERQQIRTYNLKHQYLRLQIQLEQIRKILALLSLGLGIWRGRRRRQK
ncbi:hypothetical protein [Lyngbya sp. CCY1209]|uniref:hypothetical protein n=1 Tax=Lyngbya sp. CCY1209 TaxID=2886103 RepID=UPI002D200413|nr:hypothetical protein [Lyngbya sp. CCY1209]MEB3886311.1 hypothetical protein [Lyngbya sp. CCY1209]